MFVKALLVSSFSKRQGFMQFSALAMVDFVVGLNLLRSALGVCSGARKNYSPLLNTRAYLPWLVKVPLFGMTGWLRRRLWLM
jgi:hypothetical protein